jgi:hypothetical protein
MPCRRHLGLPIGWEWDAVWGAGEWGGPGVWGKGEGRKGRESEVGNGPFGGEPRKEKLWAALYFRAYLCY